MYDGVVIIVVFNRSVNCQDYVHVAMVSCDSCRHNRKKQTPITKVAYVCGSFLQEKELTEPAQHAIYPGHGLWEYCYTVLYPSKGERST